MTQSKTICRLNDGDRNDLEITHEGGGVFRLTMTDEIEVLAIDLRSSELRQMANEILAFLETAGGNDEAAEP